jgi:hypothetical protein
MRSAFFREEGIDGVADVNHSGRATGLAGRNQNYPGRLGAPIESGLAALSRAAEVPVGGRTVDPSAVGIAARVPVKRGRAK